MTNRNVLLADARSVQKRIAGLREEEGAAAEIAAIVAGSREFRDGRFVDLSELRRELNRHRQQSPDA